MKFYRKDFLIDKYYITLLPSIQIRINEMQYARKNISVVFEFLIFHARLMWMEVDE